MISAYGELEQALIDGQTADVTAKGIKAAQAKLLPAPRLPLAEKHRSVSRVDAFVAICDRLQASLTATAATRRILLRALLAEALATLGAPKGEAVA